MEALDRNRKQGMHGYMDSIGNNMLTERIWQRVAALGKAHGLDTSALAKVTCISDRRIHSFEKGIDVMRIDDLAAFSQALDMPISELLDGIDL